MLALVPWDIHDLAKEFATLGAGRQLIVRVWIRGSNYKSRAREAREAMKVIEDAVGKVEVWVGREGGDEERRVYPPGAGWDS